MSPNMIEFLQNAFVKNRLTMECNNIKWPASAELGVLGNPDSIVQTEEVEKRMIDGKKEDDLQFTEIETSLLPIDWIYKSQSAKRPNSTFIDFLFLLKSLNNDQIYAIELTESLIEYVWSYYSK